MTRIERLKAQIEKSRKEIRSDAYGMSINEIVNMYKDHELILRPEYQRLYRWDEGKRTRFIESILLGIPIPPIFVAQLEDGTWEVIDGQQRLSTILNFMGEKVLDRNNKRMPPLELTGTDMLPDLEGFRYDGREQNSSSVFNRALQLSFKREKLDLVIIEKESSSSAKFELFMRVNTGGASLSQQEIRNAMMVSTNREFHNWFQARAGFPAFQGCLAISDRLFDEQYDMELALRFLVYYDIHENKLNRIRDVGSYLTEKLREIMQEYPDDMDSYKRAFEGTFKLINRSLGDDAFRKYDNESRKFKGPFSISAFEAISLGLAANHENPPSDEMFVEKVKGIWNEEQFVGSFGPGVSASSRLPRIVPFAREYFSK